MNNNQLKRRLYLICAAILLAGLSVAALVYHYAEDDPLAGANHIIIDGIAYPVPVHVMKRYNRDLERLGGKAAIIIDEINRWFDALWRGKSLGITLGWISVIVSLAIFLFARWLPPDSGSDPD